MRKSTERRPGIPFGTRPRGSSSARWSPARERGGIAGRVLVFQLVTLLVVVAGGWTLAVHEAEVSARAEAVARARATVVTLAHDHSVLAAVEGPAPAETLAEPIERLRAANDIGFLVVMSPDGVRYTHPDPDEVGRRFQGSITGARQGRITVEEYTGTLGPSVRVVSPIRDGAGEIVALVSAGVPLESISAQVRASAVQLGLLAFGALALGMVGSGAIARRLHRQTYGLGAAELARLYTYHDALLHALRAGLVLVSVDRTVVLCNDEARRLLGTDQVKPGTPVTDLGLEHGLVDLLASGRTCDDEVHVAGERLLVATQVPATAGGVALGWVTTLRDRTDLVRLSGELHSLQSFSESLRARAHEADNRLHTIVALVELGEYDEALGFATVTLHQRQALVDAVMSAVREPPLAALLLGKAAEAEERGVEFRLASGTEIPVSGLDPRDLVLIVGNLIDNAIDAAAEGEGPRWIALNSAPSDSELYVEVADSGRGFSARTARLAFTRGWSTKRPREDQGGAYARGLGLPLVESTVRRLGGRITLHDGVPTRLSVRVPLPGAGPSGARNPGSAGDSRGEKEG